MAYDAMENVVVLKWIMTCIKKGIISDIKMLLSIWDQTYRRAPDQSSSSGPASKATARTRGAHDGTKCRDGKCIITGTIDIDATHIMSYYLTNADKRMESTRKRFWELFRALFGHQTRSRDGRKPLLTLGTRTWSLAKIHPLT